MTPRAALRLLLPAAALLVASPSFAQAPDGDEDAIRRRFVGHYELVGYESFRESGEVVDMDYSGRIMYDEHGNMSAIGMPNDLPERARRSATNVQGGFAYWGRVTFDVANGIVVHHVEGSPTRGSWPGVDNVRYFEFTDDGLLRLSLRNDEGRTTGTLTWRRIEG
jgi:hypothetical protein